MTLTYLEGIPVVTLQIRKRFTHSECSHWKMHQKRQSRSFEVTLFIIKTQFVNNSVTFPKCEISTHISQ